MNSHHHTLRFALDRFGWKRFARSFRARCIGIEGTSGMYSRVTAKKT